MPKSKKRKTSHHHHNAKDGELSHAEIWDDSALIRSWNDALAEYEYYHSIYARGEDVEEVLRKAEEAEAAESAAHRNAVNNNNTAEHAPVLDDSNDLEDGEVDEPEPEPDSARLPLDPGHSDAVTAVDSDRVQSASHDSRTEQIKLSTGSDSGPLAQPSGITREPVSTTADSAGADQTLENIKMAYYWAGYYSGLYEGQRQSQTRSGQD